MENVIHICRQYCDACGKLLYEKDVSTNSKLRGKCIPVDFYDVTFDNYDKNIEQGGSRTPSGVQHRVVCSQKCVYESVLPVYFAKVAAKRNSKHNSEGVKIRHVYYI